MKWLKRRRNARREAELTSAAVHARLFVEGFNRGISDGQKQTLRDALARERRLR